VKSASFFAKRLPRMLCIIVALTGSLLMTDCAGEASWRIGSPAPEVSVLDLDDRTVRLSDFRGKVVVLRFWETRCRKCIEGMAAMDRLTKQYRKEDMVVLAVNMGDPKKVVTAFVRDLHLSYPVLLDPVLLAAKKYGVISSPTIFFIDRNGIARRVVLGEITGEVFDETVKALL